MSPLRRTLLSRAHAARDQVVERLTHAQFIHPHCPLRQALEHLHPGAPDIVQSTLTWLRLDGDRAIGRLRRTELVQLARCLDRTVRQHAVMRVG